MSAATTLHYFAKCTGDGHWTVVSGLRRWSLLVN